METMASARIAARRSPSRACRRDPAPACASAASQHGNPRPERPGLVGELSLSTVRSFKSPRLAIVFAHGLRRVAGQAADEALPAPADFTPREIADVIQPVDRGVVAQAIDHDEARLRGRQLLEQNVVAPHVDTESNLVGEQIGSQVLQIRQEFGYRVTALKMPPQRL